MRNINHRSIWILFTYELFVSIPAVIVKDKSAFIKAKNSVPFYFRCSHYCTKYRPGNHAASILRATAEKIQNTLYK